MHEDTSASKPLRRDQNPQVRLFCASGGLSVMMVRNLMIASDADFVRTLAHRVRSQSIRNSMAMFQNAL